MNDLERQIIGDYDDLRDELAFLPDGDDKQRALDWLMISRRRAMKAIRRDEAAMTDGPGQVRLG